jgi:allophanate hydrolase subunit 1
LDKPTFIIKPYGNAALLVEWDYAIHPEITIQVQALYKYLSLERSLSIIEMVPAYRSLLIIFQAEKINSQSIIDKITSF